MEKYYRILNIRRNASEQDIKQAYRELVKVWHPDRFSQDSRLQKRGEGKLKEINDAYGQIIEHLRNSQKRQQSHQYQRRETQEKPASQPPPKQPHNSWICPECLRTNYIYHLYCCCGFKANEIEINIYRADQTSADLYDILSNRSMKYTDRVEYLSRYLQKRFPNSKEASLLRESPTKTPQPIQKKRQRILKRFFDKCFDWYTYSRDYQRSHSHNHMHTTLRPPRPNGIFIDDIDYIQKTSVKSGKKISFESPVQ